MVTLRQRHHNVPLFAGYTIMLKSGLAMLTVYNKNTCYFNCCEGCVFVCFGCKIYYPGIFPDNFPEDNSQHFHFSIIKSFDHESGVRLDGLSQNVEKQCCILKPPTHAHIVYELFNLLMRHELLRY